MGIGGAESHIAALSRSLRSLGHAVTLCSAGGVTADILSSEGFPSRILPLNSMRPADLSESYRMLRVMLTTEHFDVVHAHARIPAYLVKRVRRALGKKADFRYCVTCHAAFNATALYRRMADWGDGTIAVSEDLRTYLIQYYDLYADRIEVIPNGIDCRYFAPQMGRDLLFEAASEIMPEIAPAETDGFHAGKPGTALRVLFMSRLDADCSAVAKTLIGLVPRLEERFPGFTLTIAGGGSAYAELSELAQKNGVQMTGQVSDPMPFLRQCDVFVGVSRAALEAMAVAKPVILAGNEGYLGVLDTTTLPMAEATNYTCRGYGGKTEVPQKVTGGRNALAPKEEKYAERLYADLCSVLSLSPGARRTLGENNRITVLQFHSAERMARETERFYKMLPVPCRQKSILIGGYYGSDNVGDDAIAGVLVRKIREMRPDVPVTLLTKHPERDEKRYGTLCVDRSSPFSVSRAMRNACIYVSGGGSLFQNLTSDRSLSYYLELMRMARRHRLPALVLSGGIGPLRGKKAEKKTAKELSRASYIGLRNYRSAEYLEHLGVPPEKLFVGADPALLVEPADPGRIAEIRRQYGLSEEGRYLAVAFCGTDPFTSSRFTSIVSEVCRRNRLTPLYFVLFPAEDAEASDKVFRSVGFGGRVLSGLTPCELVGLLPLCSAALSTRLHLLVFSCVAGIPALGIVGSDPKIAAFAEEAGMPETVTLPAAVSEKIALLFGKLLERRKEICHNIIEKRSELQKRAEEDLARVLAFVPDSFKER